MVPPRVGSKTSVLQSKAGASNKLEQAIENSFYFTIQLYLTPGVLWQEKNILR
jgi:hypothetical protein